jgi:hypothetical protein
VFFFAICASQQRFAIAPAMKAWSYCFSQESCTLASLLRLTATWYQSGFQQELEDWSNNSLRPIIDTLACDRELANAVSQLKTDIDSCVLERAERS